jgi:hypothetical protein
LRAPAGLCLACAVVVVGTAGSAEAYVRSRTSHGTPVFWPGACVFIQPDVSGTIDLDANTTFTTIEKSMQNWQALTLNDTCAYLQLKSIDPLPVEAHLDGNNIIKFRTDTWCHPEDPQDHNICYERSAAAITTVFYLDRKGDPTDGTIIDADIELNNIDFTFVVVPSPPALPPTPRHGTSIADLENTLTHEIGHLQGLDHTCKDASTPANAVDQNGMPPPPCPAIGNTTVTEATMYNSATPGETKKRSPEPDDVAGICAAYPVAQAKSHAKCAVTNLGDYTQTGCDYVPARSTSALAVGLLLALLASVRVRRRAQR